jgi:hypothetical protein
MIARPVSRNWFNTAFAVVVAAIIFYGFGQTVGPALGKPEPVILYVHIVLTFAWVLVFVAQTALIGARHARLHRRLGPIAVALGMAVVIVGFVTTIVMRNHAIAVRGPSVHRVAFLAIPLLASMGGFAVPFIAGAVMRRKPVWHRPMMLIATTIMTQAALSRIDWLSENATPAIGLGLLIVAALHDWRMRRRLSLAWPIGICGEIALQVLAAYLAAAAPPWWMATATWLMRVI